MLFIVVNFYIIYFVYRKIWWRSDGRVGLSALINTPIDRRVLGHLNTTSSLSQYHNPTSLCDSSLAQFLIRRRLSTTISEGCLYGIKKIKVVASEVSYRPLCNTGEEYSVDILLISYINKLTISDICLLVIFFIIFVLVIRHVCCC